MYLALVIIGFLYGLVFLSVSVVYGVWLSLASCMVCCYCALCAFLLAALFGSVFALFGSVVALNLIDIITK
jgi:hypothetical protein